MKMQTPNIDIWVYWLCQRTDNDSVDSSIPCSSQHCLDISRVALPAVVDSLEHVVCGQGSFRFVSVVLRKGKRNRNWISDVCCNASPVKLTAISARARITDVRTRAGVRSIQRRKEREKDEIMEGIDTCRSSVETPWLCKVKQQANLVGLGSTVDGEICAMRSRSAFVS